MSNKIQGNAIIWVGIAIVGIVVALGVGFGLRYMTQSQNEVSELDQQKESGQLGATSQLDQGSSQKEVKFALDQLMELYIERGGGPVSISPDGSLLATLKSESDQIKFWKIPSGEFVPKLQDTGYEFIKHASISPDWRYVVTEGVELTGPGFYDRQFVLKVFDLETEQELWRLSSAVHLRKEYITISPDSKTLILERQNPRSGENKKSTNISLVDIRTGEEKRSFEPPEEFQPNDTFSFEAISDGGELLITQFGKFDLPKYLIIWNVLTGEEVNRIFIDKLLSIGNVEFFPDKTQIVVVDHTDIVFLDVITGEELFRLKNRDLTRNIFFHKRYPLIYSQDFMSDVFSVWNLDTKKRVIKTSGNYITNREGSVIATSHQGGIVKVWKITAEGADQPLSEQRPSNLFQQQSDFYKLYYPDDWNSASGVFGDEIRVDVFYYETEEPFFDGGNYDIIVKYFNSTFIEERPQKILSEEPFTFDGKRAVRQHIIDHDGKEKIRVRTMQAHNGLVYVIDLLNLQHEKVFESMIESFDLADQKSDKKHIDIEFPKSENYSIDLLKYGNDYVQWKAYRTRKSGFSVLYPPDIMIYTAPVWSDTYFYSNGGAEFRGGSLYPCELSIGIPMLTLLSGGVGDDSMLSIVPENLRKYGVYVLADEGAPADADFSVCKNVAKKMLDAFEEILKVEPKELTQATSSGDFQKSTLPMDRWEIYKNDLRGFSFKYPSDRIRANKGGGYLGVNYAGYLEILPPKIDTLGNTYFDTLGSFYVYAPNPQDDKSLDAIYQFFEGLLSKQYSLRDDVGIKGEYAYTFISSEDTTVGGKEAKSFYLQDNNTNHKIQITVVRFKPYVDYREPNNMIIVAHPITGSNENALKLFEDIVSTLNF